MQKLLVVALVAAFGVVAGNNAQAALIIGSQSFLLDGIVPSGTGTSLSSINSFTGLEFSTGSTSTGSFSGTPSTSFGNSPLDTGSFGSFVLSNPAFGTFTATSGTQESTSTSRVFTLVGTFLPGTLFPEDPSDPYMPSVAVLSITLVQSSAGVAIGGGASLDVYGDRLPTDLVTPEPASIAMFGSMMLPLALGWYRRRSTVVAA